MVNRPPKPTLSIRVLKCSLPLTVFFIGELCIVSLCEHDSVSTRPTTMHD